MGAYNPRFLSQNNLQSIFLGNAYIAVAAIGMSMVIISGNIDISVGALIGVLATISGSLAVAGLPIIVSWVVPVLCGIAVAGLIGWMVAYLRIPSIVVTLGMLSILKGGLISVTGGVWISNLPPGYHLAQMRPLGVPMPVWFMVVLTASAAFWMRYSATGRAIYAVGGNAEAARLSGISQRRTIVTVFLIHGFFTGIAAVLFATQLSVIQSTVPPNLELSIITASVVGGVSILGGTGTVVGSTLAADPAGGHRLLADLRQHLALLAAGGSGRADPADRPGRPHAPPAPGAAESDGRGDRRRRQVPAPRPRPGCAARPRGRARRHPGRRHSSFWRRSTDRFLTTDNLLNQGRLVAEIGLVALPMTFIIITGGIDLSVGSIMGLCAILLGVLWKNLGLPLEAAIVGTLAAGALAGFVNGWFIARIGVPPLIMTLATLALYRGLAEGVSQARSVRGYPEWFFTLGQGDVLGVPTQLWIWAAAILVCAVVLARTTFGRTLYAMGLNETAARFSGLPVVGMKLAIYTFSGFMAGLAAWIFVSRVSTTRSDMGTGLELDVIAAVVLGGTSIFGGIGTIAGTVIGVVLIQLLKNGLALTGVKGDATIVVIGAVLILSILVANFVRDRRGLG